MVLMPEFIRLTECRTARTPAYPSSSLGVADVITYDLEAQTVQYQPSPLVEALLDCVSNIIEHDETHPQRHRSRPRIDSKAAVCEATNDG